MKVGKINVYHNKIFCSAQILQLPNSDTIQDETLFYKYDAKRVAFWDITITYWIINMLLPAFVIPDDTHNI